MAIADEISSVVHGLTGLVNSPFSPAAEPIGRQQDPFKR